jgi:crotonobetainyl-CoA:carnitine CoA-transferase CaiB-like acyl-CoA transferase
MDCDVSLYDTALSMINYLAAWHLNAGFEPLRTTHSAHPSLVPFQNFRTADSWIVIACPKEKFWRNLLTALGDPRWGSDPRFADFASRYENSAALISLIEAELADGTSAEWIDHLESHGVPCAGINTIPQALTDEHTLARELVITAEHPQWGPLRQIATAARAGAPRTEHRRAPLLGEHTEAVLSELCGFDEGQRQALRTAGAFGTTED